MALSRVIGRYKEGNGYTSSEESRGSTPSQAAAKLGSPSALPSGTWKAYPEEGNFQEFVSVSEKYASVIRLIKLIRYMKERIQELVGVISFHLTITRELHLTFHITSCTNSLTKHKTIIKLRKDVREDGREIRNMYLRSGF